VVALSPLPWSTRMLCLRRSTSAGGGARAGSGSPPRSSGRAAGSRGPHRSGPAQGGARTGRARRCRLRPAAARAAIPWHARMPDVAFDQESYWVVAGTAAPVIALANVVVTQDVLATGAFFNRMADKVPDLDEYILKGLRRVYVSAVGSFLNLLAQTSVLVRALNMLETRTDVPRGSLFITSTSEAYGILVLGCLAYLSARIRAIRELVEETLRERDMPPRPAPLVSKAGSPARRVRPSGSPARRVRPSWQRSRGPERERRAPGSQLRPNRVRPR